MKNTSKSRKPLRKPLSGLFFAVAALIGVSPVTFAPDARADGVAYLVNVHVRPGYNFPHAEEALSYGYSICGKVIGGQTVSQISADVKNDFGTPDDFQASYLISQAVNELCPAQIWQLRQSAAGDP